MTYHKLRVRFAGKSNWENVAIDEMHIEVVRRSGIPNICFVYDTDGVPCFEVAMDYDELVARLNGEEVPEKPPEPRVHERWVITYGGASWTCLTLDDARNLADRLTNTLCYKGDLTLTHLTGEEQPWQK